MKNNNTVLQEEPSVALERHRSQCSVCSHPQCQEIEREWINWGNTTELSRRYGPSRDSVYRHMHALNLFSKRQRNLKAALEKMIERADLVSVSGSAIIAAIKAYTSLTELEEKRQENGLGAKKDVPGEGCGEAEQDAPTSGQDAQEVL